MNGINNIRNLNRINSIFAAYDVIHTVNFTNSVDLLHRRLLPTVLIYYAVSYYVVLGHAVLDFTIVYILDYIGLYNSLPCRTMPPIRELEYDVLYIILNRVMVSCCARCP